MSGQSVEQNTQDSSAPTDGSPPSAPNEFDPRYYGWRVVLGACLGVMGGFGSLFVYTFSVFMKPLAAQFGWNREAISGGFAIAAVTLGLVSPFLGRWIDRVGPRRIILSSVTVFGCGILSLALLKGGLWQFYGTCFVIGLIGNGAAHLAYSRSISTWFERRLGLALSLVMVGAGLGAMILPIFAQTIVSRFGWRAAYASLGSLSLLLGLPLSWRYIRERGPNRPDFPAVHPGIAWQQGLRSYTFWIVTAILFVSSISMNGAITHLSPLLTDRGVGARDAALCAAFLGGASVIGRIAAGWLLDRFFGPHVALGVNLVTALGIVLLGRAETLPMGSTAAVLIGIGAGGEAATTPYLLTRYFGLRSFSTLYGLTWTFYAAAGAIGPVILGRAFDATGSYQSLLTLLAATLALAAGMNLLLKRYPESFSLALS
jgi:MFS family permease